MPRINSFFGLEVSPFSSKRTYSAGGDPLDVYKKINFLLFLLFFKVKNKTLFQEKLGMCGVITSVLSDNSTDSLIETCCALDKGGLTGSSLHWFMIAVVSVPAVLRKSVDKFTNRALAVARHSANAIFLFEYR